MPDPAGYVRAHVVRRLDTAKDLAVFWLRGPEPWAFEPGQYATLAVDDGGYTVKRPYSICSAPYERDLELFIELVDQGALTPRLFTLGEGDTILVRRRVAGQFTRDPAATAHACACTVTGIAPFVSMVRAHAHALQGPEGAPPQRFLVLHGASRPDELAPHRAELEALAARFDWLTYVPTVSRPWEAPGWTGETGRVEDVLRKHLDAAGFDLQTTAGYACGNPQMVENAQGVLARAGLLAERIHEEQYFTPKAEAAAPPPMPEAAQPPRVERPKPSGKRPGQIALKTARRT